MYSEFATDPKVQMMSEENQRRLVMLFCFKCNDSVTLHDEEVTFLLRISNESWLVTKAVFIDKGFIGKDNNILNWDKRQFSSDSSKNRVAEFRKRKKSSVSSSYDNEKQCNDDVTLHVTKCNAIDTEQNRYRTDTEEKEKEHTAGAVLQKPKKPQNDTDKKQNFETAALLALGIDLVLVQDFLKIRKTKLTQTAINAIAREAERAEITPSDAVQICIERSWQSFNSGWDWNPQQKSQKIPGQGIASGYQQHGQYTAKTAQNIINCQEWLEESSQ